jgi:hypothetical protein
MKESEYIDGMKQFLIPHCGSSSGRRALFYSAFFGCSRILDSIDYSGAALPFVENVSRMLLEHEYNEEPAFVALLASLNRRVGDNIWNNITDFLKKATIAPIERGE